MGWISSTYSSSNTSVATVSSSGVVTAKLVGSATITVTTNDGAKIATCLLTVNYATPQAVDLGIGVEWGSFNLGAVKQEDSGYYFPWGYTEPEVFNYGDVFFFGLDAYKWYYSPDKTLTKYCAVSSYGRDGYTDNKKVLDREDDAAVVNLGSLWRIPTKEEFTKLKEQCTWQWTSVNGTNGYRITGTNGNSIFLPAVGYGNVTSTQGFGSNGYYWSSSLEVDYPYSAHLCNFEASSIGITSRSRSYILPIRPVFGDPPISVTGVSLDKTSLTMIEGDTQTLTATVLPSNAADKSVTWSSSNTSVATVSSSGVVTAKSAGYATIIVMTNDGMKTAACSVTVNADPYGAVDLGLSVKWSSFNYGASSVTATGGYYMWGDPSGTGEPGSFTPPSVSSISGTQYDIVRKNWGGNWRIPTKVEINELYSNCSWTSTTVDGVAVLKVTGKNGASIYLPFTGYAVWNGSGDFNYGISSDQAIIMSADSNGSGRAYVFWFFTNGSGRSGIRGPSGSKFPIRPVR